MSKCFTLSRLRSIDRDRPIYFSQMSVNNSSKVRTAHPTSASLCIIPVYQKLTYFTTLDFRIVTKFSEIGISSQIKNPKFPKNLKSKITNSLMSAIAIANDL
jgi:hypothetical protein